MSNAPTPYAEVNAVLRLLLDSARPILGDKLVGLYCYGSLSSGDFDPESSDVDFLFVTEGDLSPETLDALRAMHADIFASGLRYAKKLEGSYIPRGALRRYDPANAKHPTMGMDWEFHVGQHGSNWIIERHIVREGGVVVWGPPPKTLIDPVPADDLHAAVCEMLPFWQGQLAEGADTAWLETRDYQAFAMLTMCRILYSLSVGDVVSKPQAAAWALETLDAEWRPLIEKALAWRHEHTRDDLSETFGFMRFALAKALEMCNLTPSPLSTAIPKAGIAS
jgi:hypothetical protein